MEKIKLFKKRNFGETVGTAFELLRQNIRLISMCFLVFVMPVLIVSLLTLSLGFIGLMKQSAQHTIGAKNDPAVAYVLSIIVGYFGYMSTFFAEAVVLHMAIIAYEGSDDPSRLTPSDVWILIKRDMGRIVGSFFGLFFYSLVFIIAAAIVYAIGAAISSSATGLSILLIYLGAIYVQISLSNYLMLTLRSEYNVIASLGKSLALTAGGWRWWKTFGITIVMSMIVFSFYSVSLMPFYGAIYIYTTHTVAAMGKTDGLNVIYILVGIGLIYGGVVVGYFCNLIILGHTVNYYSLIEDKEHIGLQMDIENLGMHESSFKIQEGDY
jgi:hypothetical protein